jgi:hypothetical protein
MGERRDRTERFQDVKKRKGHNLGDFDGGYNILALPFIRFVI